jgi:hypothetical protein
MSVSTLPRQGLRCRSALGYFETAASPLVSSSRSLISRFSAFSLDPARSRSIPAFPAFTYLPTLCRANQVSRYEGDKNGENHCGAPDGGGEVGAEAEQVESG